MNCSNVCEFREYNTVSQTREEHIPFGFPKETSAFIFKKLDPYELAKVRTVCRYWNRFACDHELWKKHCEERFVSPPMGVDVTKVQWHQIFQHAQNLVQRISLVNPQEIIKNIQAEKILIAHDKAFIVNHHTSGIDLSNYPFTAPNSNRLHSEGEVQVWDLDLSRCLYFFKVPRVEPEYLKLVVVGEQLFFAKLTDRSCELVSCNLKNWEYKSVHFHEEEWKEPTLRDYRFLHPTIIEFGEKTIFVSRTDKSIVTWDLSLGYNQYSDVHSRSSETLTLEEKIEHEKMLKNRLILKGHEAPICSLCEAGPFLFSGSEDGIVKKWDLTTQKCIQTIKTGLIRNIRSLKILGNYLFCISYGKIQVRDLASLLFLQEFEVKVEYISQIRISGNLLFYLQKKIIHIYDLSRGKEIRTLSLSDSTQPIKDFQVAGNQIFCRCDNKIVILNFNETQ